MALEPDTPGAVQCPDCGVWVKANRTGRPRAHIRGGYGRSGSKGSLRERPICPSSGWTDPAIQAEERRKRYQGRVAAASERVRNELAARIVSAAATRRPLLVSTLGRNLEDAVGAVRWAVQVHPGTKPYIRVVRTPDGPALSIELRRTTE